MAKMGGCNADMRKPAGLSNTKAFGFDATKRGNLSMGGKNTDLGGGATSGVKQPLGKGRADSNTYAGKK